MRKRKVLLSGATGFLGRYLLRDLLRAGREVVVLARDAGGQPAAERIDRLLDFWAETDGAALPRPLVLAGDVRLPWLGLGGAE